MASVIDGYLGADTSISLLLVYVFIILIVGNTIKVAISRLYLSPAKEIPGPFLAKLTYW
jgi:hypothetical protein